jgi:hypothetical protein
MPAHTDEAGVNVEMTGVLHLTYDVPALEQLFRDMAKEMGQEVDESLLVPMLRRASQPHDLPLDQTVKVVMEEGQWRICPDPPQP